MNEIVVEPKNELITLVKTSGLEETKQNQIAETLGVFFAKASEWNETIQSIKITSPDEVGKMKMAREGRLTLKNFRLDSQKVVKAKRDEVKYRMANDVLEDKLWLKAGQMIEATFENLETKLEEKEKFAERWELRQREERMATRQLELMPLAEFIPIEIDLLNMSDESYSKLLNGAKMQMQAKLDAEKKAEEERIAREKENGRIRVENERLRKEAEEKEKQLAIERAETLRKEKVEREAHEKQLAEEKAKADAERKSLEEKARKEREAQEARAKKEREEAEKKLLAEKQGKERLEREIKAKADKEASELKTRQLAEKKAQSAPDKAKLIELAKTIDNLVLPDLKSDESKKILNDAKGLLKKVSIFIKEKAEQL